MKYLWLFLSLFVFALPKAEAAARKFGLGIVIAAPTAVTAEYIYGKNRDVAASLGWGDNYFHLNLDHHWNRKDWIKADGVGVNVYFGLGLRWISWSNRDSEQDSEIGLRVPFGVQHIFKEVPIQIFFELAPALIIVHSTAFTIDIAIGARYFF